MGEWFRRAGRCGLGRITGFGIGAALVTCDVHIAVWAAVSDVLASIVLGALGKGGDAQ